MSVINVCIPSKDDLHFPLQEAKFLGHGFLTTGPNNSHYQTAPFPTFWFFSLGWSLFQSAFHFFLVLTDSIEQLHNWKKLHNTNFLGIWTGVQQHQQRSSKYRRCTEQFQWNDGIYMSLIAMPTASCSYPSQCLFIIQCWTSRFYSAFFIHNLTFFTFQLQENYKNVTEWWETKMIYARIIITCWRLIHLTFFNTFSSLISAFRLSISLHFASTAG